MQKDLLKIKKVIFASIAFFLCMFAVAYAQIEVQTGITISATVTGSSTPPVIQPSTGGGGGGNFVSVGATVNFSGRAYPFSRVVISKDFVPIITTVAGQDAKFFVSISGLTASNYNFSVYGEDSQGRRSDSIFFPLIVEPNVTVDVSGIFISPTIDIDKTQVVQGDNVTIFGQSVPNSNVVISIHSANEIFQSVPTDKNGVYLYTLDTSLLEIGAHTAKSKTVLSDAISSYSKNLDFLVEDVAQASSSTDQVGSSTDVNLPTDVPFDLKNPVSKVAVKDDINGDHAVNIIDYSIMSFWYDKPSPPKKIDLNHDGVVNLVDFSILAYYWTG